MSFNPSVLELYTEMKTINDNVQHGGSSNVQKMRELHGRALQRNYNDLISAKNENDFANLSKNDSIIQFMTKHIKNNEKQLISKNILTSSDSNISTIQTIAYKNPINGGGESCGMTRSEPNVTEFVNNMRTSEASRFADRYGGTTTEHYTVGGKNIKQNTIINYWGDWCGYSNKFKPTWDKFASQIKKTYPSLQVIDYNANNTETQEVARNAGIESFPTVVLYSKGKTYKFQNSKANVGELVEFVKSNL
jgi:thiol-disulfide isomerase/thioredoxin